MYDSVARLIGAHRDEIALVENTAVTWRMAFYGMRFAPGDRILTAQAEYAANSVAFLQTARRTGVARLGWPSRWCRTTRTACSTHARWPA